jgi:uncharacterized protein YqeY
MIKRISADIIKAMKSGDKKSLNVLRSLKAAIKNREIELGKALSDDEVLTVLTQAAKSREQAIELYVQGKREDLADIERDEIKIIKGYLPQPLTEEELTQLVEQEIAELGASSMKDMGKVMKGLSEKTKNRADGKLVSTIVRSKLS